MNYPFLSTLSPLLRVISRVRIPCSKFTTFVFPYLAITAIPFFYSAINIFFNFIVVQVQFSAFSFHLSPWPQPSPPPSPNSTHPWFCPCVLYSCSWKPFPLSPPLSPPTSPLVTVSMFLISMSLVIFCLLVLLIRLHLNVRSCGICLLLPGFFHPCCHKG